VTSEYPYPGSNAGSDGSSQPDPYDAPPQRPQYGAPEQPTPFDAFGGSTPQDEAQPPRAAARAAVRMPGLIVSSPSAEEAVPPQQPSGRGAVYGGSPAIYGSPSQPTPAEYGRPAEPSQQPQTYGQPSQPQAYGQPSQPQAYGQPSQPAEYGQPSQPQAYGQPSQPQAYGQPSQPAEYGQPSQQPQTYGQPSQPQAYGQPSQPQAYGQPSEAGTYGSAEPRVYGRPNAADEEPPPRPAAPQVPQQRTSAVYGQRQAPPDAPPSGWQEAPQQPRQEAAPAWQQPQQQAQPPARPAEPPAQFEQHGRRTQGPGGYNESPSQRSVAWQDQLQPMQPIANPPVYAPPSQTSLPTPVDVSVIPAPPRSKLKFVGYGLIVVAIIAAGCFALYYTAQTDLPTVGKCVQQSGNAAIEAPCTREGAFRVTQTVANVSECRDYLNQPSLSYTSGGKVVVLCLEPASGTAPSSGTTPSAAPSTTAPATEPSSPAAGSPSA
jgi:hypothetical protein